jgi:hypothetical protein
VSDHAIKAITRNQVYEGLVHVLGVSMWLIASILQSEPVSDGIF